MSVSSEKTDKIKRRSDMACRRCRARKLKCENKDSVAPCKRCEAENQDCVFLSVADDAGAIVAKSPKSPNYERGSSDESRNSHPMTPVPPARNMASIPLHTSSGAGQRGISPPHAPGSHHGPTPTYYSRQLQHGHHPANTTSHSFPSVDNSQKWPASAPQMYPGMATPYGNQEPSRPRVPTSPSFYTPPSEPQYPYGSGQPPTFNQQGYYAVDPTQPPSNSQQQYYLANSSYQHNPQPSGLPGYPDPNIISNSQQDNGNDYYFTR